MKTFFTALGSEENLFRHEGITSSAFESLYELSRNPWELSKAILHLTSSIPDDSIGACQDTRAPAQKDSTLLIATEVLKLIFFRLSNNLTPERDYTIDWRDCKRVLRVHDQFVMHLVEAVSRTHPEMLSSILSGSCVTTNAIKESVFRSAIRQKNYIIVSRLLQSGVDPNLPITASQLLTWPILKKGKIKITLQYTTEHWNGIKEAAFALDAHLAKILLDAGASANRDDFFKESPLEIAILAAADDAGASDRVMEFAQLVVEHHTYDDHSILSYSCMCSGLIPAITHSIARHNVRVTKFLISKAATIKLPESFEVYDCKCVVQYFSAPFIDLDIPLTLLHVAIVSGDNEMIDQLLQPLLSCSTPISMDAIKEAIIISCLAGDAVTASKLLTRYPEVPKIGVWTRGVTPLVAAAWNQDNIIASMLLELGAHIGPTRGGKVWESSEPTPIHVAAYWGNTGLVQQLMDRGADCNVCFTPSEGRPLTLHWLLSCYESSTPLGLALENKKIDTVKLLIPQSRLIGGELAQAVHLGDDTLISDLISSGADVASADREGWTVLDTAVEMGNLTIISLYFSSGGRYRSRALYTAVKMALVSKDYSVIQLLASHRSAGEIDAWEATSLASTIKAREWSLVFLLLDDPFLPGPSRAFFTPWDKQLGRDYMRSFHEKKPPQSLPPLSAALLSEETSVINAMLQRGYVPRGSDLWALQRVPNVISQSVLANFPLDISCHRTLLLYAVESGDVQRVREHIKSVESLDFASQPITDYLTTERSPLQLAAYGNDVEVVRLLLDAGADADFNLDEPQSRPLLTATEHDNLDMVKLLLDRGDTLHLQGQLREDKTALQISARKGNLIMARLLISRGADINAICGDYTALECAAAGGSVDMVQLLLASGARLDGKMRLFYVRSVALALGRGPNAYEGSGSYAIANYLKDYGSWTESDQILYERCTTGGSKYWNQLYLRYDDALDHWQIDDSDDSDDSDSDSDEFDGIGEGKDVQDNTNEPGSMTQAWHGGIDLTLVEPYHFNIMDEQTTGHGLVTPHVFGSERIIELKDVVEGADAAQFGVPSNLAGAAAAYGHAADQLVAWAPDFDTNALGTNTADDLGIVVHAADREWEGPFSGNEVNEINERFGVLPFRGYV